MIYDRIKCPECTRDFATQQALAQHQRAKHPPEPSFANRVIDAQLEAAMGGKVDDDLTDWI